jgi:uncharacterized protein
VHFARESLQANVIRAVEGGRVRIGEQWFSGPLIVSAEKIVTDWQPGGREELTLTQLEPVLALEPEILLIGSGPGPVLPNVELIGALAKLGVGLEMMTTDAACRTFNVLVNEYRRVVVALFDAG